MGSKILRDGDRYKAKLDRTLADGKVTVKEADALLRDARDGEFKQVEAHYLAGFVDRARDKFDPAARARLVAFVATELEFRAEVAGDSGRRRPLAQPTLTADTRAAGAATWSPRAGEVTVGGMGWDDALQGQVGDCYFISALAAVAWSRPEALARALTVNRDGTYTVTFHQRRPGEARPTPIQVTVDGTFAQQHGRLEYAAARETRELWPLIFEKAYAAWKGGYDAIEGGMAATALEALTGTTPDFFPVASDLDARQLWARLEAACAGTGAVVALSKAWEPSERGIVADHAYTVLGVEERNGERLVTLRNPWGEREPGHDGRDDGVFSLPLSKFMTSFATVEHVTL